MAVPHSALSLAAPATSPITHVVIIDQENHSFDNVLGRLCVRLGRCDGTTTGRLANGRRIRLSKAKDVVSAVNHSVASQRTAIDGGRMDGFSHIEGCLRRIRFRCYSQYQPGQVPNLTALASNFVISDRTFEDGPVPSWGSHLDLVAATLDGFTGDNPVPLRHHRPGPGWGCDSFSLAQWRASASTPLRWVPACVPNRHGNGAFRPTPVEWVPTIMDVMDRADVTWRIYQTTTDDPGGISGGYGWAICPTFADCLNTSQAKNMAPSSAVIDDARSGTLPNVSLVMPNGRNSQHNGFSMRKGDNWIGKVVGAIEQGPDWPNTAIFITYDDCGCFYDHVAPPPDLGIRVPMVIVSPYAKRHFTDTGVASFSSLLAFIEHDFGLPPLSERDANAYDYSNSFDLSKASLAPVPMTHSRIPASELRYIAAHPPSESDFT